MRRFNHQTWNYQYPTLGFDGILPEKTLYGCPKVAILDTEGDDKAL